MSVISTYLEDNLASITLSRSICRQVLWGMVQFVKNLEEEINEELYDENLSLSRVNDELPLCFSSNKIKKKQKCFKKLKTKTVTSQSLPRTSLLIEDNLFLAPYLDGLMYPAHIYSLGSKIGHVMIRYLGYPDIVMLPRSQLCPLPIHNREACCLQYGEDVRLFESFILSSNIIANDNAPHRKYWDQRYRLFSKFDEGIKLDEESWYSITPEAISLYIAQRIYDCFHRVHKMSNIVVLDCFCGCGGNTIACARHHMQLLASDIDRNKLENCRHNASIYGADSRIDFVQADAYSYFPKSCFNRHCNHDTNCEYGMKPDIVILAPPWGGPEYSEKSDYSLRSDITSGNGIELVELASRLCSNIVYIIPKNTSLAEIKESASISQLPHVVEDVFLHGKLKLKVVYYGSILVDSFEKKKKKGDRKRKRSAVCDESNMSVSGELSNN